MELALLFPVVICSFFFFLMALDPTGLEFLGWVEGSGQASPVFGSPETW